MENPQNNPKNGQQLKHSKVTKTKNFKPSHSESQEHIQNRKVNNPNNTILKHTKFKSSTIKRIKR